MHSGCMPVVFEKRSAVTVQTEHVIIFCPGRITHLFTFINRAVVLEHLVAELLYIIQVKGVIVDSFGNITCVFVYTQIIVLNRSTKSVKQNLFIHT